MKGHLLFIIYYLLFIMLVSLFIIKLHFMFFDFVCIERSYITYIRMREQSIYPYQTIISLHVTSIHVTFTSFHSFFLACNWHPVLSCAIHVVLCCVVLCCNVLFFLLIGVSVGPHPYLIFVVIFTGSNL